MYQSIDEKNEKWKTQRCNSYVVYLLIFFTFGASLPDPTIWIYVSRLMTAHTERLNYGLVNLSYTLTAIVFPVLASRSSENFRCLKVWMVALSFSAFFGSILYSIPFDPIFAILGRILVASQTALRPIIIGEIIRTYKPEEASKKIGSCVVLEVIGRGIGPLLAMTMTNLDTWILGVHFTYGNITGLLSAFMYFFLITSIVIMHQDISKSHQLDNKDNTSSGVSTSQLNDEANGSPAALDQSEMLKRICSHPDTLLVLIITFMSSLWRQMGERVIAIVVIHALDYSYAVSNTCYVLYATFLVLFTLLYKNFKGKKHLMYYGMVSLDSLILFATCLRVISNQFGFGINMALLSLFVLGLAVNKITENFFSIVTFVHLLPPNQLCFAAMVHDVVSKAGMIVSDLCVAYMYKYIEDVYILILVSALTCGVLMIARKNSINEAKSLF